MMTGLEHRAHRQGAEDSRAQPRGDERLLRSWSADYCTPERVGQGGPHHPQLHRLRETTVWKKE